MNIQKIDRLLRLYSCTSLTTVYFQGNAPAADSSIFDFAAGATAYYLPGTTGWSSIFAGLPIVLWNPQIQTADAGFGIRGNQFGFDITGTTNIPVAVEASADLANPVWLPLQTITLTNGLFHFSELLQTNSPGRFYRLSPP